MKLYLIFSAVLLLVPLNMLAQDDELLLGFESNGSKYGISLREDNELKVLGAITAATALTYFAALKPDIAKSYMPAAEYVARCAPAAKFLLSLVGTGVLIRNGSKFIAQHRSMPTRKKIERVCRAGFGAIALIGAAYNIKGKL